MRDLIDKELEHTYGKRLAVLNKRIASIEGKNQLSDDRQDTESSEKRENE